MKTLIITLYELKRIFRNWRLILIILSQPILIGLIVGFMSYKSPENIQVGIYNKNTNQYSISFENELKKSDKIVLQTFNSIDADKIKESKIRALVVTDFDLNKVTGEIEVLKDPTGSISTIAIESEVNKAAKNTLLLMNKDKTNSKLLKFSSLLKNNITINNNDFESLNISSSDFPNNNLKFFDYYGSAIMILLVYLVVLNMSSISISSEKESGVFERISSTPYSKINIVLGKAAAQYIVGIIVALMGFLTIFLAFHISIGNVSLLVLVNLISTAVAVAIGMFISAFSKTIVESIEIAMYVFFIAVLTSGIIMPKETAHPVFLGVKKVLPFFYATDASRKINMSQATWHNISSNIYVLCGFLILLMFLAIIVLRKETK
jgi:ABC-2 type transport system permease protein